MTKRDRAEASTVAWVDLQTPDLAKARQFYGGLLGWSFSGGDDPHSGYYTMAQLGGRNVAGLGKLQGGAPSTWNVYMAVESADATAKRVSEAGGSVVMPPMDAMEFGRMAVFTDPTGAHFGVWQSKLHHGAELIDEPGSMTWHEVYSRDVGKARDFYARVFGLEAKPLEAPGIDYWTFHKGAKTAFGALQMTAQFPPSVPSHWNSYFAVANVDASTQQVAALGGAVNAPPFDTPYGRIAVVSDPFGASFRITQPAGPASR